MKYFKSFNTIIFLLVFSFAACSGDSQTASHTLNVAQTEALIAAHPTDLQIIDLRTPSEIARTGILPGARVIDVTNRAAGEKLLELPKDKPVLLYCASGARSAQTQAFLQKQGYTEVYDMAPGISGWMSAGKKTSTPRNASGN